MYRLYNFPASGNCYKIRLLLTQLAVPFEQVNINMLQQENRLPDFLQKNPSGKVPVLEIEPDVFLFESSAILLYLSEGTEYLSSDRLERTQVIQWLCFEQYSLGANLSRPRFWISIAKQAEKFSALIDYHQRLGNSALEVLDQHLSSRSFVVNNRYSIADIALFSYTHVADEGGFDLAQFPSLQSWIERVKSQPDYIPITQA